jgi:hypothetical protein
MKCVNGVYSEMTPEEEAEYQAYVATNLAANAAKVPTIISDRQFAHALALINLITKEAAIAWVSTGTIPLEFTQIIDALPDETQRFGATMLLAGATQFERNHPMVEIFRVGRSMTAEQVDDIFRLAGTL